MGELAASTGLYSLLYTWLAGVENLLVASWHQKKLQHKTRREQFFQMTDDEGSTNPSEIPSDMLTLRQIPQGSNAVKTTTLSSLVYQQCGLSLFIKSIMNHF